MHFRSPLRCSTARWRRYQGRDSARRAGKRSSIRRSGRTSCSRIGAAKAREAQGLYHLFVDRRLDLAQVEGDRELLERLIDVTPQPIGV
jgi:hypothetical protein